VRKIDPEPGTLVLFPSYLSHATNPTNADAPRICVAFNATLRKRGEPCPAAGAAALVGMAN
jgi:hypothetical protein